MNLGPPRPIRWGRFMNSGLPLPMRARRAKPFRLPVGLRRAANCPCRCPPCRGPRRSVTARCLSPVPRPLSPRLARLPPLRRCSSARCCRRVLPGRRPTIRPRPWPDRAPRTAPAGDVRAVRTMMPMMTARMFLLFISVPFRLRVIVVTSAREPLPGSGVPGRHPVHPNRSGRP